LRFLLINRGGGEMFHLHRDMFVFGEIALWSRVWRVNLRVIKEEAGVGVSTN